MFWWFFLACEKRNVAFKIQMKNLQIIAKYSKYPDLEKPSSLYSRNLFLLLYHFCCIVLVLTVHRP